MRLIDADALKNDINAQVTILNSLSVSTGVDELRQIGEELQRGLVAEIDAQPTVDAVPREELFDLFIEITAAEYGKQRFFMQKDGTVYDRHKGDYLHNFDLAVVRFCNELSDG